MNVMTDVFDALAHPARRALLDELRDGPARAGELGSGLEMSREAISKHLRLMVQAGLLDVEERGRERRYAIRGQSFAAIDDWLQPYRAFWMQRLDALETEVARGRRGASAHPGHSGRPITPEATNPEPINPESLGA